MKLLVACRGDRQLLLLLLFVGTKRSVSDMTRVCSSAAVERISKLKDTSAGHPRSILNSNKKANSNARWSFVRNGSCQSQVHRGRIILGAESTTAVAGPVRVP
ncbi:hypothetical protein BKA57DRAFT_474168 [Linnemannia elongata]|nr:hypothetical protein BKA57DRAFT_474168 [Linnemannia elongata]